MSQQSEWRFCQKCQTMFFDGFPDKGLCAAGGGHLAEGFNFNLTYDIAESTSAQAAWRFCAKCHVMFYDGFADNAWEAVGMKRKASTSRCHTMSLKAQMLRGRGVAVKIATRCFTTDSLQRDYVRVTKGTVRGALFYSGMRQRVLILFCLTIRNLRHRIQHGLRLQALYGSSR